MEEMESKRLRLPFHWEEGCLEEDTNHCSSVTPLTRIIFLLMSNGMNEVKVNKLNLR